MLFPFVNDTRFVVSCYIRDPITSFSAASGATRRHEFTVAPRRLKAKDCTNTDRHCRDSNLGWLYQRSLRFSRLRLVLTSNIESNTRAVTFRLELATYKVQNVG